MKKVVSINHGKFLGSYIDAQNSVWVPDETYFFIGVLFSMVLPQIIYCIYGGLIPLLAVVSNASVGYFLGWTIYHRFPHRITSCFNAETEQQAPPDEGTKSKAA